MVRSVRALTSALLLAASVALPSIADAQLRAGFRSTLAPRGDDTVTPFAAFGFSVNVRGGLYNSGSACMNGYISLFGVFDPGSCLYPGQSNTPPTLAFLGEVFGTAVSGLYRDLNSTSASSGQLGFGSGTVDGRQAFGFTWDGVFLFGTQVPNFFQVLFVNRASDFGAGDFDIEYNYGALASDANVAAGVADDGGFSGVPYTATVTAAPNSRSVQCFRGGSVNNANCTTNVVPEPGTVALVMLGLVSLTAVSTRRRRRAV